MSLRLLILAALCGAAAASAQPVRAPLPAAGPESLTDEFDGPNLDENWRWFHAQYGWPSKVKAFDVGRSTPGSLHLEPFHSAWVRDLYAPFLFRRVGGDFDVRARVRMKSRDGAVPSGTWSLGGLMARVPNGASEVDWAPNRENWHFVTTGVGYEPSKPMTETKATYNSHSSLKLRPFRSGWVELRLVRIGMALFALARTDGSARWELRDRFYRMDMAPVMEVGLIAYTTSAGAPEGPENAAQDNRRVDSALPVDAVLEVDWIRGRRPVFHRPHAGSGTRDRSAGLREWYAEVSGANPLSDPNLPAADVLRRLGD